MPRNEKNSGLEQVLDRLSETARQEDRVTVTMVIDVVGKRSFGPLLMVVGLILVSPLSGIFGIATTMSIIILLIALQLLIGQEHLWLPQRILGQSIKRPLVLRAIDFLLPAARFIDRWVRPRLTILVQRAGTTVVALVCIAIALVMPAMELVPFSATTAGIPLTFFGLALFVRDGVLVLFALTITGLLFSLLFYNLVA